MSDCSEWDRLVKEARERDHVLRQKSSTIPLSGRAILSDMRDRERRIHQAFIRAANAMNGAAVIELAAAKADAIALLTILQDTTQSRSVAERCAKAKAVLA